MHRSGSSKGSAGVRPAGAQAREVQRGARCCVEPGPHDVAVYVGAERVVAPAPFGFRGDCDGPLEHRAGGAYAREVVSVRRAGDRPPDDVLLRRVAGGPPAFDARSSLAGPGGRPAPTHGPPPEAWPEAPAAARSG